MVHIEKYGDGESFCYWKQPCPIPTNKINWLEEHNAQTWLLIIHSPISTLKVERLPLIDRNHLPHQSPTVWLSCDAFRDVPSVCIFRWHMIYYDLGVIPIPRIHNIKRFHVEMLVHHLT
ncbi:hypothetical protein T265_05030 [Opisthorchis viverrini]|uniref:Uncharacterized protein n=1 Tax=Opisthorchis viverrini TaxID=6198 RepID=A0A074ZL16_OPIVI|nr:hypothetical protein T265_05030 [Opisthorchis viverrini]KER28048.1 hypothetical protein T265_05030 [Opisthorchis viverrini]